MGALLPSVVANVWDYGAVGDDVTDSTDAFHAAIATGKPVVVPQGFYRVNLTVDRNAVNMRGAGRRQTVLRSASGVENRTIVTWGNGSYRSAEHGQLSDLTIDGETTDLSTTGLKLSGATFFNLSDVEIMHCTRYGLWVQDPSYWSTFTGLLVDGIGGGGSWDEGIGIYLDNQSNALSFRGTHVRGCVYPGLWIRNSVHVYFEGSVQTSGWNVSWPYGVVVRGASTDVDLSLYAEANTNGQWNSADVRVVEEPGAVPSVRIRGTFNGSGQVSHAVRAQQGWTVIDDGCSFQNYTDSLFYVYDTCESFKLGEINPGWGSYDVPVFSAQSDMSKVV